MKVQIKKYANRKLYIPKKGYVNLPQVAELIKAGNEIEVTSNETGKDLTNSVLREILTIGNVELSNEAISGIIRG